MKITVSRREIDTINLQEKPIYTLTVSDGVESVSVNILREEAYRTIDAHGLTAYEEANYNSFTENRWDNTLPAEEDSTTQTPL